MYYRLNDRLRNLMHEKAPPHEIEKLRLSSMRDSQSLTNEAVTSSRALGMAIINRHAVYSSYLIEAFSEAAIMSSPDNVHCCYPSGPLMIAIYHHAHAELEMMLEEHRRASGDFLVLNHNRCVDGLHNRSPLRAACRAANFTGICLLLKYGADVDLDNDTLSYPVDAILPHGMTQFELDRFSPSSRRRMAQIIRYLLQFMTLRRPVATRYLQLALQNSQFDELRRIHVPKLASLAALARNALLANFEPEDLDSMLKSDSIPAPLSAPFNHILNSQLS